MPTAQPSRTRLLNNDSVGYADVILNGGMEEYLRTVTDYRPLNERG